MARLNGKTALVTGGTSGIGLATAKRFQQEGARVAITGVDPARLEAAAAELGRDAAAIAADAGDVAATQAGVRAAAEALGGLDIVFLNAGIVQFASLAETTEAAFDAQFDVNVRGVLFGAQAAAPLMRKGGSLIVTGSINGLMGMAGTAVYGATKAAVRAMVRVMAGELAPQGIRVNIVSPGPVETPIFGKLGLPEAQLSEIAAGLAAKIPMGRFGKADEIARIALFLASDDSSFVTGEEIVADGGWTGVGA